MTDNAPQTNQQPKSTMAIVGLVLAVLGLITSFMPIINNGSFVLALVAVILGVIAIVSIKRGKRSGMGLAVTTVVLGVITCIIVVNLQSAWSNAIDDSMARSSGEATEQLLGTEVDVQMGDFVNDSANYDSQLPVMVTNLDDEGHSYSIEIEAVNADGDRIKDDTVYANDLGAGQKQSFEAFQFVTSDEAKELEGATFKVMKVSQY